MDAGQTVKRGQPLMRIDPDRPELATRAQRRSRRRRAGARAADAQDEARYRDLVGAGAVSASAYDQVKAAAESARAELQRGRGPGRRRPQRSRLRACWWPMRTASWWRRWRSRGRSSPPGRRSCSARARRAARSAIIELAGNPRPAIGSRRKRTLYGSVASRPARPCCGSCRMPPIRQTRTFEARYVLEGALAGGAAGRHGHHRATRTQGRIRTVCRYRSARIFDTGKGPGVWVIDGEPAKVTWRAVQVQRISDETATRQRPA